MNKVHTSSVDVAIHYVSRVEIRRELGENWTYLTIHSERSTDEGKVEDYIKLILFSPDAGNIPIIMEVPE